MRLPSAPWAIFSARATSPTPANSPDAYPAVTEKRAQHYAAKPAHLKVGNYPLSCPLQEWANLWLTLPSPLGSLEAGQPRITTRPKASIGAALDGKRQGRVP